MCATQQGGQPARSPEASARVRARWRRIRTSCHVFARHAVALLLAIPIAGAPAAAQAPESRAAAFQADEYRIVQWATADGLPQNTVTDIAVLSNRELWLATFGGLARFDGDRFQVLDIASDDGLPANRIVSIAPAGPDAFWMVTQDGHLGRVERGRARPLVAPTDATQAMISLVASPSGRIFSQSQDGRVWHTDGRQSWQPLLGPARGGVALHAFAITGTGEVWMIRADQALRLGDRGVEATVSLPGRSAAIAPRDGGGLWLGLAAGVFRLVDERLEALHVVPALDGAVTSIEPAGPGSMWVATGGELSRLDREPDGTWRRIAVPAEPAARFVHPHPESRW